jgi:hypothetical protein
VRLVASGIVWQSQRCTNMRHIVANEQTAGESVLSGRLRDNCVMINSKASNGVMKD